MGWWLQAVIAALAAYGVLTLLHGLWRWVSGKRTAGRAALSVILIMRNEERTVEGLMAELLAGQSTMPVVTDIIAVDLGSSDNTPAILRRLARQHVQVRCILLAPGATSDEAVAVAVRQCRNALQLCLDTTRSPDLRIVRQTLAALGRDPTAASVMASGGQSA